MAICIMLTHMRAAANFPDFPGVSYIFLALSFVAVSMFFFLSGYGMMISVKTKGNTYISDFPRNRILYHYIIMLLLIVICAVFRFGLLGQDFATNTFLLSFAWGDTVIFNGWFLQAILLIYIGFYLVCKCFASSRARIVAFAVLLAAYCVFCLILDMKVNWYNNIFAALFGMLWAEYKERFDNCIKNKYWIILILATMLFCGLFLVANMSFFAKFLRRISSNLSAIFICIVVVLLLKIIPIQNRFFALLGKYNFEIYVTHGMSIALLHSRIVQVENVYLFYLLSFIITALLSLALHPLFQAVNKLIKRKKV